MLRPLPDDLAAGRAFAADRIRGHLSSAGISISDAIADRALYFRISVVAACNLTCAFCHNEGAPKKGKIDKSYAEAAVAAAARIGYERVQLTGGEPTLRPDLADLVSLCRRYVSDVGITTNGTHLAPLLPKLVDAGLTRLHISLQEQTLAGDTSSQLLTLPPWLNEVLACSIRSRLRLRINLPVPDESIPEVEELLPGVVSQGTDIRVFTILPQAAAHWTTRSSTPLRKMAERVNGAMVSRIGAGRVIFRGYSEPQGFRCASCDGRAACLETSHSLRLGADLILRPCLASRAWDLPFIAVDADRCMDEATVLALDYVW